MVLEAQGYDVEVAHEALEAFERARSWVPDVVLLDIGLPDMSGYEAAQRLRAERGLERVVLVALTGYEGEIEREHSRAAGFDHHLVKPVEADAIAKLVAPYSRVARTPPG